jgi:hypothetical protein
LIYFFCDHRDAAKQKLRSFLAVSILQLVKQRPDSLHVVEAVFERYKRDLRSEPADIDLIKLLKALCNRFERVVIVIDALDEAEEPDGFLEALTGVLTNEESKTRIHILVTSRHERHREESGSFCKISGSN